MEKTVIIPAAALGSDDVRDVYGYLICGQLFAFGPQEGMVFLEEGPYEYLPPYVDWQGSATRFTPKELKILRAIPGVKFVVGST